MANVVSKRPRRRAAKPKPLRRRKEKPKRVVPKWFPVLTAFMLTGMLVLTINYRAYSELTSEKKEFHELNEKVQQATTENLSLQEEIFYLKTDPKTVERDTRIYSPAPQSKKERPTDLKPTEREATKIEPTPSKKEKVSKAGETDIAEKSANRQPPTRK
jgi:cytoskeletal protein RodZ